MFGAELLSISSTDRLGAGLLLAEAVATAGLLIVILGCVRAHRPPTTVAFAVGAYIMAAIFFTASTAFANPAVTIARVFTDTFAGIAPAAALAFIPVQLLSASVAVLFMRWLYPPLESVSGRMVVPDAELEETGLPGTERRKSL
jgi:glycerol uptake facilitator-like aquaporin